MLTLFSNKCLHVLHLKLFSYVVIDGFLQHLGSLATRIITPKLCTLISGQWSYNLYFRFFFSRSHTNCHTSCVLPFSVSNAHWVSEFRVPNHKIVD